MKTYKFTAHNGRGHRNFITVKSFPDTPETAQILATFKAYGWSVQEVKEK